MTERQPFTVSADISPASAPLSQAAITVAVPAQKGWRIEVYDMSVSVQASSTGNTYENTLTIFGLEGINGKAGGDTVGSTVSFSQGCPFVYVQVTSHSYNFPLPIRGQTPVSTGIGVYLTDASSGVNLSDVSLVISGAYIKDN